MSTETVGDTELFTQMVEGLDDGLYCDWGDGKRAAGFLICGECQVGQETECVDHRLKNHADMMNGFLLIVTFNTTCGHAVPYPLCGWKSIKGGPV